LHTFFRPTKTRFRGRRDMKIGLPRALMFYRYYPFLAAFLEGCGCEVCSSPPTNLKILGMGTDVCVDDVCVAAKVLFGHVRHLEGKVDAILIPRLVSVDKKNYDTFTCPKLIAAPDMIRYSFPHLPPPLEFTVDISKAPWWWSCFLLGRDLNVPLRVMVKAYRKALREQERYETFLHRGFLPAEALRRLGKEDGNAYPTNLMEGDVAVAVVGHPYLIGDPLVNKRLLHWLELNGARVFSSTMLSEEDIEKEASRLAPISWSYERELLAAAAYFLNREDIDGIIYLTSFGCGPDSLITEMVRRELNPNQDRALLELVLDEHSAESGVRTRVEAFVDMLRYHKKKASCAGSAG
jgi:predicted nucleotide-binding protein (sugar kinase/HSP70/actin superfamily)